MTRPLAAQAAVHGDEMVEEMRRMLLETNPWLLGLTMAVSLLHSLFDFLAFKNDVQFWRDNKSMKGISLNSLLLNLFIQAVIFLYLLDSDTSWASLLLATPRRCSLGLGSPRRGSPRSSSSPTASACSSRPGSCARSSSRSRCAGQSGRGGRGCSSRRPTRTCSPTQRRTTRRRWRTSAA